VKLGPACHALEWRIRGLLRTHPKRIILDLSAVDSMDSAGLGTLVNCYWSALQAGGAVRLAGVHGRVEQVIRRAALDTVLPCFPAVEDACRDFHAGAPSRI
jgi:anti-anti-sigma factor